MGEGNVVTENCKLKITIMIPTYNQEAFIREAIESALAQTYPNLEVIVGDDASTDNTSVIVNSIQDTRLKYVRNPINIGRTANYRNLLYNHASGDFVVNLDGDDYYTDNDFVTEAVKVIAGDRTVVIVAARASWKHGNIDSISDIPNINEASGMYILKQLPNRNFFFKHMATIYKRAEAIKIDFYKSSSNGSDWDSLYRLSLRGNVRYLDKCVGVWRIHGQNESGTSDYVKLMKSLEIWPSIYKDAISNGMNSALGQYSCAKCIAFFASSYCANISLNGNIYLLKYLLCIFKNYWLSSFVIAITPEYAARVIFSFIGYFRRRNPVLRSS